MPPVAHPSLQLSFRLPTPKIPSLSHFPTNQGRRPVPLAQGPGTSAVAHASMYLGLASARAYAFKMTGSETVRLAPYSLRLVPEIDERGIASG